MNTREPPFQAVISLGGFCQVAYQIEQRFGFRISSPFDWLVTPLGSVTKILSDEGACFGKQVKVLFDGKTAVCTHYGVAYHHEFARNADGQVLVSEAGLQQCRGKLQHKYRRFSHMMRQVTPRTLFIRMGGHHDSPVPYPYVADERPLLTRDLNDLCDTLAQRFPALSFAVAAIVVRGMTDVRIDACGLDDRVRLFDMAPGTAPSWEGDVGAWAPVFDCYRFDLRDCSEKAQQFVGDAPQEYLHA